MKDITGTECDIKGILEKDFKRVNKFDTKKGGIYIEISEDPRGWIFGDKTRKIYEGSGISLKSLADLLVTITSNNDGSEIKVSVYNPEELGRMLLSKNDDVGSSIQYADVDITEHTELSAKIGCHVCVESIMKGNWIRAQIFPGINIIDIIKKDESEMMEILESNQIYMKEKVQQLVDRYYSIEEEIDNILSKFRNCGKECDCRKIVVFKQIYEGELDEIMTTCLNCGGTVE